MTSSSPTLRFDGRVAIVTGAGGGLGRAHALLLASRGATVVVNDLGGSVAGAGGSEAAAQMVVREIEALAGTGGTGGTPGHMPGHTPDRTPGHTPGSAPGRALANYDDIGAPAGAERLVQAALAAYGRVDILINNAGILRDKTLHKMDPADFEAVVRVHLLGSAWCSRAVLPVMQQQQYGRIVMTTSAAGLYGNFGQTNYAAAKLGVVGLMNALKLEAGKYGIHVNTVAPVALTRMTEGLPFARMLEEATPERVAAGVAFLASEACDFSGAVLAAGAGYFSTVRLVEGQGVHAAGDEVTPEFVAANWARIDDASAARPFGDAGAALMGAFAGRG